MSVPGSHDFLVDRDSFVSEAALAEAYSRCAPAPRDRGTVRLLVARLGGIERAMPVCAEFSREEGLVGDVWTRRPPRDVNAQITVMRHDVATFVANGQSLGLFGDNVFVDFDISSESLPPGTRLRVGSALVEVNQA